MYPIRTNVRSIYFLTGRRILRLSQSQFSTPYVLRRICLKPSRITTQNVYGKKPLFNTKVELYLAFKILRGFRTKKDQEAVTETKTLSVEDVSKTTSDLLKKIFSPAFIIIAFGITILWVVAHTQISFPLKKLISYGKTDFKAEIPNVSFNDVRGIDEVKQDLMDVVEYLKDPERFTNLGGKLPKGILLVGPPGTGKTLLARAIAGEAGVPFYYASGSEFDEMFVGVGSARIRGLFSEARENAPCIVFIDEIDACGSARTSSPLQPYARQTINQLLQEMDGFESNESVIVLGATNMRKVLDKALTRPGRFDTQINILAPDIKGRKDILELYVDKIVRSKDLDLERIACLTGGMTGADLSNLVNHAAIRAAQRNKSFVEMVDFEYSLDKLRMGPELKSRLRTEKELENTAFHEAGHALVAFYTPSAMPVFKVTIGQRGASLGHTSLIPKPEDEISSTRAKLIAQIDVAMGGRAAEEILSGKENVTTGASQDLEQATKIARHLVCDLGMSETLGFITYDYESTSPKNKKNIEIEVNQILTSSYNRATELLSKYSSEHKLLAKALLKYETLALDEIKVLFAQSSLAAVENLRKKQSSGEKTNVEANESDMHDQYGLTPM